jgi:hypothetical protein
VGISVARPGKASAGFGIASVFLNMNIGMISAGWSARI